MKSKYTGTNEFSRALAGFTFNLAKRGNLFVSLWEEFSISKSESKTKITKTKNQHDSKILWLNTNWYYNDEVNGILRNRIYESVYHIMNSRDSYLPIYKLCRIWAHVVKPRSLTSFTSNHIQVQSHSPNSFYLNSFARLIQCKQLC